MRLRILHSCQTNQPSNQPAATASTYIAVGLLDGGGGGLHSFPSVNCCVVFLYFLFGGRSRKKETNICTRRMSGKSPKFFFLTSLSFLCFFLATTACRSDECSIKLQIVFFSAFGILSKCEIMTKFSTAIWYFFSKSKSPFQVV